jgi:hypothetical protein
MFAQGLRADFWTAEYGEEKLQWDTESRKATSIRSFLKELQRHLRKITAPCEIYLLSMTPHLEWAMHRTGQKGRQGSDFQSRAKWTSRYRRRPNSKDSRRYCIQSGRLYRVRRFLRRQRWAQNCDEYIAINFVPSAALAKWIPWSDLYRPQSEECLFPRCFITKYTLGLWRQHFVRDTSPLQQVAKKVVRLAIVMINAVPGHGDFNLDVAISLIVRWSDWGYEAAGDKTALVAAARLWTRIETMTEEFRSL